MHGFLNALFEVLPLMEFKASGSYLPWVIMNIGLLLTLVITAQKNASDEELNNLINAVQELRLVLVNYRAKEHF